VRTYGLPEKYTARIEEGLNSIGYSLSKPGDLAEVILRLSDHYQKDFSTSPWHHEWARAAYLSYYFPLNYARATAVTVEGFKRNFFTGLENLIDYGSGTGAAILATHDYGTHSWKQRLCYEPFTDATLLLDRLTRDDYQFDKTSVEPTNIPSNTLSIFSYSLNELEKFPEQFLKSEALMLIEPSTRELGRNLLKLRDDLIMNHGFFAYAPCPHQGLCPLLNDSQRDWCHDRFAWKAPQWFSAIETLLPIKNPTLTYSYVLLRKTKPQLPYSTEILTRVVGDPLAEKGKTRQLICMDSQRRFLSWMPQRLDRATLDHFNFDRGDLLFLKSNLDERGEEVRVKESQQVAKLI
jgi:hypothetical protein